MADKPSSREQQLLPRFSPTSALTAPPMRLTQYPILSVSRGQNGFTGGTFRGSFGGLAAGVGFGVGFVFGLQGVEVAEKKTSVRKRRAAAVFEAMPSKLLCFRSTG
ncbi:hypothetical protein HPP92_010612 [Vanilla planifolia]|uniref:Uncharacterized protein n=1 Tax=Vanilla planifolia TaxID=51239 RepID=A0A835V2N9_VANPL|nr:hypothetical protein HPP92_010612 [Vanilla planifolia]